MISLTYLGKKVELKNLITIEEYLNLLNDVEDRKTYTPYLKNDKALLNCMLKWKDDDSPGNWAGAYPLNYVHVTIDKYTGPKPLLTEYQVFQKSKEYCRRSRYYRMPSALERAGFNDQYWIRPFDKNDPNSQLCSYSEMTDEELAKVESVETDEDKLFHELKMYKSLTSSDFLPKNQYSIEHPYRLRLSGNDDCSYSMFYNVESPDDIIGFDSKMVLVIANWYIVNLHMFFSN